VSDPITLATQLQRDLDEALRRSADLEQVREELAFAKGMVDTYVEDNQRLEGARADLVDRSLALKQALAASQADLTRVERERDEARTSVRAYAARTFELLDERDSARAELATATDELEQAIVLLGYALHLRMHGECAPGGNETWDRFDRDAEAFLRLKDGKATDD
jgi:hypothetical protein